MARKSSGRTVSNPIKAHLIAGASVEPSESTKENAEVQKIMQRILLDEFAPPAVIVDSNDRILCSSGELKSYLIEPNSNSDNTILKRARTGLRAALRKLLKEGRETARRVVNDRLSFRINGVLKKLVLTVQPLPPADGIAGMCLVIFSGTAWPDPEGRIGDKVIEEELWKSKQHLSMAMASARMGSFVWEPESDKVVWDSHHRSLSGLRETGTTGSAFFKLIHPEDVEANRLAIEKAIQGEQDYDAEFRIIRADGTTVWLAGRGKIVAAADGQPLRMIGLNWDITDQKMSVEKIRLGEARLQRIIEGASVGIALVRSTGDVYRANDAALGILGIDKNVFLRDGYDWRTAIRPQDLSTTAAIIGDLVETGRIAPYEVLLQRQDGSLLSVIINAFMIDRANDEHVVFLFDLTLQKEQERQIRDSEQRLRLAIGTARLALWEWDIVDDQIRWSRELEERIGLEPSESIGSFQEFLALIHVDDRGNVERLFKQCLEDRSPLQAEFRMRQSDGTFRWLMTTAHVSTDKNDSPTQMIGVELDITDRKVAEEQDKRQAEDSRFLSEAGETLASSLNLEETLSSVTRLAVPALADWAFIDVLDDQGISRRIKVAHGDPSHHELAARVARFPANCDVMAHTPARALFKGESLLISEFTDERIVQSAQNAEHEDVIRNIAPRSLIVVPLIARNLSFGALTLVTAQSNRRFGTRELSLVEELARRCAVAIDNARLFEAGQQANISKSQFLANMSHEIRTPMTAVLGYADLLADNETDPEKAGYLRTIKRNGQFLLEIINDVLDLSKIEFGKLEIERVKFAPHKTVRDVVALMKIRADEKELALQVEFAGSIPVKIESDSKRLKQILINLIGNAIKFTESGGVRLVIQMATGEKPQLHFDVIDTGIGMTEHQQSRLFQPFSQGDASVTRAFGGTGLGLAISHRLAALLGGCISVESEWGQGSRFSFSIDVGDISQTEMIQPDLESMSDSLDKPKVRVKLTCRVLVVDDRRDVRILTKHFLTKAGAEVELAEDGLLALEFVTKAMQNGDPIIDLILLDMQMPRLDGYQTAIKLRKMGFQQPIIALTADAMHGDMNRCLECGCNAYLSKPIDGKLLIKMVDSHVRKDRRLEP